MLNTLYLATDPNFSTSRGNWKKLLFCKSLFRGGVGGGGEGGGVGVNGILSANVEYAILSHRFQLLKKTFAFLSKNQIPVREVG